MIRDIFFDLVGMKGIVFQDMEQLISDLRKLGIKF